MPDAQGHVVKMAAVTKEDAALEELFMQLKKEFVSKKKVNPKTVRAHFLAHVKQGEKSKVDKFTYKRVGVFVLVPVLSLLVVAAAVVAAVYKNELIELVQGEKCMVDNNLIISELTRPVFNCEVCRHMDRIERVANISRQEFLEKYAYTTIPVVITGATDGWKALDTFSYKYFKTLYNSTMKEVTEACQFFNWGYPFDTFEDVFSMTDAQARLEPGEASWYIGW